MFFGGADNKVQTTQALIDAINQGEYEAAESAIQQGADVNCRIKKRGDGYRIALDNELQCKQVDFERPYVNGGRCAEDEILYEVPMVNTTTLLNVISRLDVECRDNQLKLARLLMENGAELGAIDYASYWVSWGPKAPNYFQNTPLLNAIANENHSFALLYMEFLLKLEEDQRKSILDYKDKFIAGFHTALEFAIRRGFSHLATQIVRAGANPNPQPFIFSYGGKSPLHMACMILGQSNIKNRWHPVLGSGLELILTLLEHGAEFNSTVSTDIFTGFDPLFPILQSWKKAELAAFDHIDVACQSLSERPFDYVGACNAPCLSPTKSGQIKHPFLDEDSFLSGLARVYWGLRTRETYLASEQFQTIDKLILQRAILKRIIRDFLAQYEDDSELRSLEESDIEVQEMIDRLLEHPQHEFFYEQLQYGGIIYHADKGIHSLTPLSDDSLSSSSTPSY